MSNINGMKPDGQPYKVLIVDDSPLIHKLIRKALEPIGFDICAAGNNGKEGVELYDKYRPDIITMDITMPIKDGLQASKEILIFNPNAKIVMLTSIGDEETLEEAKKIGIKHFITKPFKNEEFIRAIIKVLDK